MDETLHDSNDVMAGSYNDHTYQKESLTHFESFAYFHNYYNIPQRCFANCTNLSKIYLPIEQTISFGDECFMLCTNLSELGSLKTS